MAIGRYRSRLLDLQSTLCHKSLFLFGPRQTGKSTLVKHAFPEATSYSLLDSDTFLALSARPSLLREQLDPDPGVVVIDEIQKLPLLLDEVHWLIEERGIRFVMTGSSARKLHRGGVNLLGGRARSRSLHPFVALELGDDFDLLRALNRGLLPSVYFSDSPGEDLKAYAGDYLTQEIAAEGLTRNVPAFSRFLEVAVACHGQLINYSSVASDAQVPRTTVHEYFRILSDTLIGCELPAWRETVRRKPIVTPKFYFFDVGVVAYLSGRGRVRPRSSGFGAAFEGYIFHELKSYVDYRTVGCPLAFWRSKSGFEVDFILGDKCAIEVKAKANIAERDLRSLRALKEEASFAHYIVVSDEERPRVTDGVHVLPWRVFLERLWQGAYVE